MYRSKVVQQQKVANPPEKSGKSAWKKANLPKIDPDGYDQLN